VHIEWNVSKAAVNRRKHGVAFEDAANGLVRSLSLRLRGDAPDHSLDERRLVTFGKSAKGRLLAGIHTDHHDVVRIISARPARASRKEIIGRRLKSRMTFVRNISGPILASSCAGNMPADSDHG